MGSKGVSFSLAILTTFLLLSTAVAGPRKLSATKGDDKWQEIMTKKITAAIEKAKAAKPIAYGVAPKLPAALPPATKESIDSICKSMYDYLIFQFEGCLEDVKNEPSNLKSCLSNVTFFDCKWALEEDDGIILDDVNKFYEELNRMCDDLLTELEKIKPEYA